MKNLKYLLPIILFSALFIAYKKEAEPIPYFNMEGEWSGKTSVGKSLQSMPFDIKIKQDGIIERLNTNGGVTGTGTWKLSGNRFFGTYSAANGITVNIEATVYQADHRIAGSWTNTTNKKGSFFVTSKLSSVVKK